MRALFIDYRGWRIHAGISPRYFAWNLAKGFYKSKLLEASTQQEIKEKIRRQR